MAKNTSFSIGDRLGEFVATQVEQGRYSSASDVVRAGLRLLEQQEIQLAGLRAVLIEGEQRGPATPFDVERACGSHVTFYRTTESLVEIVRVLHESMDSKRHVF